MRTIIHSGFALASLATFAAETETGSAPAELPNAQQPVPSAETVSAITDAETAKRKANTAKQRAARNGKPADKPSKPATGKRSKPVAAKATTEAKPDPRAARAERLSVERADIGKLYAAFEAGRQSVPVKPVFAFKLAATSAHPNARQPSARQAAAIAVAFAAAGKKLATGSTAARVFEHAGKRVAIENGVLRDAVSSGMLSVSGDSPETETLRLTCKPAVIIGLIGERAAKAGKLI